MNMTFSSDDLGSGDGTADNFGPVCITFFLLLFFVALRLKSTAMVMAGGSVHLTTLFPGQA